MSNLNDLTEEIRDLAVQVHAARDRVEEKDIVLAAHQAVERVSSRYKEILAALGDKEKLEADRTIGRRLTEALRLASTLPRVGTVIGSTPDRVPGRSAVGERRITGVSWTATAATAPKTGLGVGTDVEAWCGPCGAMTTHSIVAMVGNDPRQVACQTCNGRHGYRTTPARKVTGAADGIDRPAHTPQEKESARRAEQKAEELRALGREVHASTEVKSFDPKVRYRSGEIIAHPEFGRGKVETVLRSSLLVRFANGGLKSVMLQF